MPTSARSALALTLLLAGCAGGDGLDGGEVSFGSTPGASQASMPSMPAVTTGAGTTTDTDATTRPTGSDPTFPTTGVMLDDTGVDPGDTSTSGVDGSTSDGGPGETTAPVELCGNGAIDAPEECDGAALGGQTCMSFGFSGGTLACAPNCLFDKSMCTSPSCGDGTVDMGEECDCGNQGMTCTGAQLANSTCTSLQSPKGTPFAGGTLACNSPNSCSFNKAGCTYCGDGVRNGGEPCDGADLGGQSCAGLGFSSGTLTCNGDCSYNTGACQSIVCGNGVCEAGEDSCNCGDCPDDPNACSSCECQAKGGPFCWCDDFCVQNGDCCAGGPC